MTVYKYSLEISSRQSVRMPSDARILSIQAQRGEPCIWALVDEREKCVHAHKIRMFGTGHPIPDIPMTFLGTFQVEDRDFVFHVFEEVEG